MSDTEKPVDSTPASTTEHKRAKPGEDNYNQTVVGAGGELMSGTIADITDGDTHKVKKHK